MILAEVSNWEVGTWIITTSLGIVGLAMGYAKRTDVNVKNRLRVDSSDEQPLKIEKTPKRYNHDAVDQRFVRIETRLDGHDSELDQVWESTKAIETKQAERHLENSVALAKIMTRLGINTDTNAPQV